MRSSPDDGKFASFSSRREIEEVAAGEFFQFAANGRRSSSVGSFFPKPLSSNQRPFSSSALFRQFSVINCAGDGAISTRPSRLALPLALLVAERVRDIGTHYPTPQASCFAIFIFSRPFPSWCQRFFSGCVCHSRVVRAIFLDVESFPRATVFFRKRERERESVSKGIPKI